MPIYRTLTDNFQNLKANSIILQFWFYRNINLLSIYFIKVEGLISFAYTVQTSFHSIRFWKSYSVTGNSLEENMATLKTEHGSIWSMTVVRSCSTRCGHVTLILAMPLHHTPTDWGLEVICENENHHHAMAGVMDVLFSLSTPPYPLKAKTLSNYWTKVKEGVEWGQIEKVPPRVQSVSFMGGELGDQG